MFFHLRDLDVRAGRFDVEIAPGDIDFQLGAKDKDTNLHQAGPLRAQGKAELVLGSDAESAVLPDQQLLGALRCFYDGFNQRDAQTALF